MKRNNYNPAALLIVVPEDFVNGEDAIIDVLDCCVDLLEIFFGQHVELTAKFARIWPKGKPKGCRLVDDLVLVRDNFLGLDKTGGFFLPNKKQR